MASALTVASTSIVEAGFFDRVGKNLKKTGRKIGVKADEGSKDARKTGRKIGAEVDEGTAGFSEDKGHDQPNNKYHSKSTFVAYTTNDHTYRVNKSEGTWKVTFGQRTNLRHYTGQRVNPCNTSWKEPNKITTVKKGQWLELQLKNGSWVVLKGADHR